MRQSMSPVQFNRSTRVDTGNIRTSGRAGVVVPVGFLPVLVGDSVGGSVGIDIALAEMDRPLDVGVYAKFQSWFIPKTADPRFSGRDEFMAAMTGNPVKALGSADRPALPFFHMISGAAATTAAGSEFFKTLGIHVRAGVPIQSDLLDAFALVYNFRLNAISNALKTHRMKYAFEDIAAATVLPPAPWPNNDFQGVVSDYERALVVGSLDLDVLAGRLPVSGLGVATSNSTAPTTNAGYRDTAISPTNYPRSISTAAFVGLRVTGTTAGSARADLWAEMTGQQMSVTLADFDKARTAQAFAKLRNAYAGNDYTGFDNDDTIIALLMSGITVPQDEFGRPWLLDSKTVPVNYTERLATDGASLDASVTTGRASARLATNVPKQDVGGTIIYTVEVLPERLHERMGDDWLHMASYSQFPDALRDVLRVEPVDEVYNYHVDVKHTTPSAVYGYRPMNDRWNRRFTRLGGIFYEDVPGAQITESRMGVWQSHIIDPVFDETHYLAPVPFPHSVFSDNLAPAFEIVARHVCSIVGLTQFGDVLLENNDDYAAVAAETV